MYIGIKIAELKDFEKVADYIIKECKGKKANCLHSSYSYYKVDEVTKDNFIILYYYLDKRFIRDIKIVPEI